MHDTQIRTILLQAEIRRISAATWVVGCIWLVAGVGILALRTRGFKVRAAQIDLDAEVTA